MTEYAPRNRQDLNPFYSESQIAIPHYTSHDSLSYGTGNQAILCTSINTDYSGYSTNFLPNQHSPSTSAGIGYLSACSHSPISYHVQPPPRRVSLPSHSRIIPHCPYLPPMLQTQNTAYQQSFLQSSSESMVANTEDQESFNHESMCSEPFEPPLDGYPSADDFDELIRNYLTQLSPKKQDKALIHARRAANIKIVLMDKKTTAVESAQFRFWVKKMFTLLPNDPIIPMGKRKICHEGKPVAIREKLFKILTRAHQKCQHGGRDKTSAQVRRVYSWVPKELISRFVKLCPTCQMRRGMKTATSPEGETSLREYSAQSLAPQMMGSANSKRTCALSLSSTIARLPPQLVGGSAVFQNQNRWMTDLQSSQDLGDSSPHMQDSYQNFRFKEDYDGADQYEIKRET